MNVPAEAMADWGYPPILEETAGTMGQIMGHNELLYINNTYQFSDYWKYESSIFNEPEKAAYRKEVFPKQCEEAYNIGKALV